MAASSFSNKLLRVTFTLSNNAQFPNQNGANTLVLSGLRTVAVVRGSGAPAWPNADVAIYGMKQADMNALVSLAFKLEAVKRNNIQVEANSGNGWSTIFDGQIVSAQIDYSARPEVCLRIQGQAMYLQSLDSAAPASYTGPTDVATILQSLAVKAGFNFVNNGVSIQLSNPYCPGTIGDQIKQIVAAAGCEFWIENRVMAISPKGSPRDLPKFTLSPSSGLIGYPVPEARGYINVRALYNPAFRYGGPITIAGSDVIVDPTQPATLNSKANGDWYVGTIMHTLESLKFDGAWFTDMQLQPLGTQPVAK